MLKLNPPLNKQHCFFSEPSKDVPWLRIGTPSSHSRAPASPRCGKTSCPSKETTLISGSTRPSASSYSKLWTPYRIARESSNCLFQTTYLHRVPISLLNDRILVCPAIGIKEGLTVISNKVRTRCVEHQPVVSDQHLPCLQFTIPEPTWKWIERPTFG